MYLESHCKPLTSCLLSSQTHSILPVFVALSLFLSFFFQVFIMGGPTDWLQHKQLAFSLIMSCCLLLYVLLCSLYFLLNPTGQGWWLLTLSLGLLEVSYIWGRLSSSLFCSINRFSLINSMRSMSDLRQRRTAGIWESTLLTDFT